KWRLWLAGVAAVTLAFVTLIVATGDARFGFLVEYGCLILALTFMLDSRKRFYLWTYGTAAVVAAPFLLSMSSHLGGMSVGNATAVGGRDIVLFFSVYLLATGYVFATYPNRPVLVWLAACIGVTLFLGFNHAWGWDNHPYRFVINLIFPLGIG